MQASTPQAQAHAPTMTDQPADTSRRNFIQGALASGAALGAIGSASLAHAQTQLTRSTINHYHIAASAEFQRRVVLLRN